MTLSLNLESLDLSRLKAHLKTLTKAQKIELILALEERERRIRENYASTLYPDTGPLRRELYDKQIEFFNAGAKYKERLFMAANRDGKTLSGSYEMKCHATAEYPEWWEGRRFDRPVHCWAVGDNGETTRDIVQRALLGPPDAIGTGMVPKDKIFLKSIRPKAGSVPNAIDGFAVKSKYGVSTIGFKCYAQGQKTFMGVERDVIWWDEECPMACYGEMLMRTATTKGIIYGTFTPLAGMTELVMSFMPKESRLEAA